MTRVHFQNGSYNIKEELEKFFYLAIFGCRKCAMPKKWANHILNDLKGNKVRDVNAKPKTHKKAMVISEKTKFF